MKRFLRVEFSTCISEIIRWERLKVALAALADGHTCTQSAHIAGFYDGPHFTRVCNAMFGLPPTRVQLKSAGRDGFELNMRKLGERMCADRIAAVSA